MNIPPVHKAIVTATVKCLSGDGKGQSRDSPRVRPFQRPDSRLRRQVPQLHTAVSGTGRQWQQRPTTNGTARDGIAVTIAKIANQRLRKHAIELGRRHGARIFAGPLHRMILGLQIPGLLFQIARTFALDRARLSLHGLNFHCRVRKYVVLDIGYLLLL